MELKILTTSGVITWNCIIEAWCCFIEEEFCISFESLSTSVERRGFELLSPFLVPYFTNRRVDEVTEELLFRYMPEALSDPKKRNAVKLVKKMGMDVRYYDVYEHHGVRGIIFFTEDELIVGEDRYETDEDGNRHLVKTKKSGKGKNSGRHYCHKHKQD